MSILLYPPRCPVCDRVMDIRFPGVCRKCREIIRYAAEPCCKKCGKPLEDAQEEYCEDCRKRSHSFTQARGVWIYQGRCKSSMYRFKYENRRRYAAVFAKEMWSVQGKWINGIHAEVLIPVPLHIARQRQRGYNQASLLAKELSRLTGIPEREDFLVRTRQTQPLKALSRQNRKMELKRAFLVPEGKRIPRTVLLIDDIYTTGSTVDACSKVLLAAGADKVYVLCMCMGE